MFKYIIGQIKDNQNEINFNLVDLLYLKNSERKTNRMRGGRRKYCN